MVGSVDQANYMVCVGLDYIHSSYSSILFRSRNSNSCLFSGTSIYDFPDGNIWLVGSVDRANYMVCVGLDYIHSSYSSILFRKYYLKSS